jgi:transposase
MEPEGRKPYPTDLTDEQWEILEPLVPAPKPGPQPVKHTRREILNAIFYGCRSSAPAKSPRNLADLIA